MKKIVTLGILMICLLVAVRMTTLANKPSLKITEPTKPIKTANKTYIMLFSPFFLKINKYMSILLNTTYILLLS